MNSSNYLLISCLGDRDPWQSNSCSKSYQDGSDPERLESGEIVYGPLLRLVEHLYSHQRVVRKLILIDSHSRGSSGKVEEVIRESFASPDFEIKIVKMPNDQKQAIDEQFIYQFVVDKVIPEFNPDDYDQVYINGSSGTKQQNQVFLECFISQSFGKPIFKKVNFCEINRKQDSKELGKVDFKKKADLNLRHLSSLKALLSRFEFVQASAFFENSPELIDKKINQQFKDRLGLLQAISLGNLKEVKSNPLKNELFVKSYDPENSLYPIIFYLGLICLQKNGRCLELILKSAILVEYLLTEELVSRYCAGFILADQNGKKLNFDSLIDSQRDALQKIHTELGGKNDFDFSKNEITFYSTLLLLYTCGKSPVIKENIVWINKLKNRRNKLAHELWQSKDADQELADQAIIFLKDLLTEIHPYCQSDLHAEILTNIWKKAFEQSGYEWMLHD